MPTPNIYALSRCFYPKWLTVHSAYMFFISLCASWESNPQPFALLTQCSTTEPQYSWSLSVSGHNSSVAVPPDLSGSSGGRWCDWLGLAELHPAPASLQPGDPEQRGTQRQAGQRSLRQTQHSSEEPEPGLLSVPEAHSGPHWEGLPGAQKLQLQGQGSIHTDVSFIT